MRLFRISVLLIFLSGQCYSQDLITDLILSNIDIEKIIINFVALGVERLVEEFTKLLGPIETIYGKDDGYLTTMQLAEKHGYICEEHFVQTYDGYILSLHRLTGRISGPKLSNKAPTVLFLPGFFSASTPLIVDGEKSAGGILSDEGFDVWIGNFRGNRYSNEHDFLEMNETEFWNFTYNENVFIDCKVFLNYILNEVKKPNLHVIGYSQGGVLMASLLANSTKYNNKVKSFSFLATGLVLREFKWIILDEFLRLIRPFTKTEILHTITLDTLPYSFLVAKLSYDFCNTKSFFYGFCSGIVSDLVGNDYNMIDKSRFPVYLSHMVNGGSTLQVLHLSQYYTSDRFYLFDYGEEKNINYYNKYEVPTLDYMKINGPKLFIYGTKDNIVTKNSALASASLLDNMTQVVEVEGFNHMHFMHANNIKSKVYDAVAEFIKENN